jgi:cytochrome c biogenesis protein CcdA
VDALFEAFYNQAMDWINVVHAWVAVLPVSYAFAAGMLATLNPCGFVMLPAFATFYLTAAGAEPEVATGRRLLRALLMGALVTATFALTFGLAGTVVTAGGRVIIDWAGRVSIGIGVALALFGAYQLLSGRSLFARFTSGVRVQRSGTASGVVLFGLAYAVCSLGCTLPIFLVVVGATFVGDRGFIESVRLFIEYAAGMGLVLTLVTLAVALLRDRGARLFRPALGYVDATANTLLIFAGSYIVWYWMTKGTAV